MRVRSWEYPPTLGLAPFRKRDREVLQANRNVAPIKTIPDEANRDPDWVEQEVGDQAEHVDDARHQVKQDAVLDAEVQLRSAQRAFARGDRSICRFRRPDLRIEWQSGVNARYFLSFPMRSFERPCRP